MDAEILRPLDHASGTLSPSIAAIATLALNAGLWFRRGHLVMACSSRTASCRCGAKNPLIAAVQISETSSVCHNVAFIFIRGYIIWLRIKSWLDTMQTLGLALHDAARLMKSAFERQARGHRLSLMQWRTLGALDRCDGISQAALAARVEASQMTMSDIIDRLEGDGLVRRESDPSDGRAKLVWIADAAKPVVEEMHDIASDVYAAALDGISSDDIEGLTRCLRKIVKNLETAVIGQKDDAP